MVPPRMQGPAHPTCTAAQGWRARCANGFHCALEFPLSRESGRRASTPNVAAFMESLRFCTVDKRLHPGPIALKLKTRRWRTCGIRHTRKRLTTQNVEAAEPLLADLNTLRPQ